MPANAPDGKAGERQGTDEKPLRVPVEGEQQGEDHDQPVDAAHGEQLYGLHPAAETGTPLRCARIDATVQNARHQRIRGLRRRIGYDFPGALSGQERASRRREETAQWCKTCTTVVVPAPAATPRAPAAARGVAVVAFAGGVVVGPGQGANERAVASEYVRAWAKSDFVAMYGLLDPASRQAMGEAEFTRATPGGRHRDADRRVPRPGGTTARPSGAVAMRMRTRLFGILSAALDVPVSTGVDRDPRALLAHPAVPRAARGRAPHPRRGHARPGRPAGQRRHAAGPRAPPQLPDPRRGRADRRNARPDPRRAGRPYAALGYPPRQGRARRAGADLPGSLAGTPGGTLLAGAGCSPSTAPVAGAAADDDRPGHGAGRDPAIAGRYAGMVAMDPRTGARAGRSPGLPSPPCSRRARR